MQTISNGLWSSLSTWGGKLPTATDKVQIMHDINLDIDAKVAGVMIMDGCELCIDAANNITLESTSNIVVMGRFCMEEKIPFIYTVRFTDINENKFVGGGMDVLDSDIGLWAMGNGQLDLQGIVQPTFEKGVVNPDTLSSFASSAIRNIRIEGTATGKSHIFIMSSMPQNLRYVQFRYMGPRKDLNGDGAKELVTGRYALHFHHCDDGSRGSIVEGCIARDCDNHCFVPHTSHGITMRSNIAYNVTETPFWYDYGQRTNDIHWENNLVALIKYVERAQDQDSDMAPTFGAGGFVLGFGDSNICRGNVVIGTSGDFRIAAAYFWPEIRNDANNTLQLESQWQFENNTAINCPACEGSWQNNNFHHVNLNTTAINCEVPVYHGAYTNDYNRKGGYYKGGYVNIKAASATTNRIRFEGVTFDADGGDYCVVINEGPATGAAPILFLNCKFINFTKKAILNQNPGEGIKTVDVVDCGIDYTKVQVSSTAKTGEWIRVQLGDKAWKVTKSGSNAIAKFAPSLWGTGTGLKAEYFTPDFKTLLLSRIEPNVNLFDLTHPSPHYKVPATFAARWTGKIQPQYSTTYKFICKAGGGVRLWVNGALLIDAWAERYPSDITSKGILLDADKLYDIKLEFFNNDDRSGCTLEWTGNFLTREFIPMSQLYPGDVTPPPPVNQPPTADAGPDQTIIVETSTTLNGTGMDPEGKAVAFKWEQISGIAAVIINPTLAVTRVSGLRVGEYIFRLTVIDDKGASSMDDMKVTVT